VRKSIRLWAHEAPIFIAFFSLLGFFGFGGMVCILYFDHDGNGIGIFSAIILALQGIIFAPAIAKVFWTAIALIQEISSTLWFRAKMRMVPQR
jgi:hypothetical protein